MGGRLTGATTATYLYCLVRSPRSPRLAAAPRGLPGLGRPRAIPAGEGLWLVGADAPLARYGPALIERRLGDIGWVAARALAHEAVVEYAGRSGPVVPMKLFTLFTSDRRAVEHVERARRQLTRVLRRVAGCREWGIRISVDDTRARALARARARRLAPTAGAGTRFLLARRGESAARRTAAADVAGEVGRLFRRLAAEARAARRRPGRDGAPGILLEAAFLVPVRRTARFRARVREATRPLAARGGAVALTGPWPPYHFVGRGAR
jgi:hypothetical protein